MIALSRGIELNIMCYIGVQVNNKIHYFSNDDCWLLTHWSLYVFPLIDIHGFRFTFLFKVGPDGCQALILQMALPFSMLVVTSASCWEIPKMSMMSKASTLPIATAIVPIFPNRHLILFELHHFV